jgi:hypothetical protein
VKGQSDGRNRTTPLAKAIAEVVGRALHRAASTPPPAGTEGAAASDGTGAKPLVGRATPACDRSAAFDKALGSVALLNAELAEDRLMLESYGFYGGQLTLGGLFYRLGAFRMQEAMARNNIAAMNHEEDVIGGYR